MAVEASLVIQSSKESKPRIQLVREFFLDYRKVDIKPEEVVTAIVLPLTRRDEYVRSFKQARRREDDIAIVNAGIRVLLKPTAEEWTVRDCSI